MHIAAELGHEEVVEILLESNAFVNVRNKHGMTPLHLAARRGNNKMIRQLVTEHGALLDALTLVNIDRKLTILIINLFRPNKRHYIMQLRLVNCKFVKLCSV